MLVDKTAFARFDTNSYSLPPDYVQKTVTLVADDRTVSFFDGANLLAKHSRSYGRRQRIEDPEHRAEILRRKRGATAFAVRDRLRAVAPGIDTLFERWVALGRNVGSMTVQTNKLLNLYGENIFALAVAETIARGTHDPGEIGVLCEKHRRAGSSPVPIDVPIGDHIPDRDVIPHDLGGYDAKR